MHAEELIEFETQLATVHTIHYHICIYVYHARYTLYIAHDIHIIYSFAQIFDAIIIGLGFRRLHHHPMKDEIFRSSINE